MTIAICIACGAQKFGAFTSCQACGFQPRTVIDEAKSLMLSDHNFPPEELYKFKVMIESRQEPPYDPVSLAHCAEPILEERYFWEHFDESRGVLPCMKCRTSFKAELEEALCPRCRSEVEEPLSACPVCFLLYESNAKHCQKCGALLSSQERLTPKNLGTNMALFVRRAVSEKSFLSKSQYLADFRAKLSDKDGLTSDFELEILAMYTAMLTLSKFVPSKALIVRCVREMVELYRKSFVLRGADSHKADAAANLCAKRFDEYDRVLALDAERWMFFLANEATKNCYGVEKHLGATIEMSITIGYFVKVCEAALRSTIGVSQS